MTDIAPGAGTAAPYVLRELGSGSFVYEIEHALPAAACADMIERFERNIQQQYRGRIGADQAQLDSIKRSTDLRISGRSDWRDVDQGLFLSLRAALDELERLHPFLHPIRFATWVITCSVLSPGSSITGMLTEVQGNSAKGSW